MSTPRIVCRQCSNTSLLTESEVIGSLSSWIYILFHVQYHRWDQKKTNLRNQKNLWNGKVPDVTWENLKMVFCVSSIYQHSQDSQREDSRADCFLSTAALRSVTFAGFLQCSSGKLWELAVPMSLVPGIQRGRLPGVLCLSQQETRRVWKPTWQVGLHWKLAWFLSEYCQSHPIPKVCSFCVRSAFSGKKKKLIWKVCTQQSAQWQYVPGDHSYPKGGF